MKSLFLSVLLCLLTFTDAYAVEVKILVKERYGRPAQERPFPDLLGFTLRSSPLAATAHPSASCPTATNAKGELVCKIECTAASTERMRLYIQGPRPELSPSLKGYVDPEPQVLEIDRCSIKTQLPLVLVYRTPESYYAEAWIMYPGVFSAIGLKNEKWPLSNNTSLVEFSASFDVLEKVAIKDPKNIDGLFRLSKLADLYQRLPPDERDSAIAKRLGDYRFGAASVMLKAGVVVTAAGPTNLVVASPSPEEYYRSVSAVENQLKNRPSLTSEQLRLYEKVREYRLGAPAFGIVNIDVPANKP